MTEPVRFFVFPDLPVQAIIGHNTNSKWGANLSWKTRSWVVAPGNSWVQDVSVPWKSTSPHWRAPFKLLVNGDVVVPPKSHSKIAVFNPFSTTELNAIHGTFGYVTPRRNLITCMVANGVANSPTWVQVANPGNDPLVLRNNSHICDFHSREEWETQDAFIDPTDQEFKELSAELSVNMGNGVFDDPVGNTSRADPACASDECVLLSGAIPGYSMKVGDTPTNGETLWSCRTGQPVTLEPETQIISGDGRTVAITPNPQDRCLEAGDCHTSREFDGLNPEPSVNMGTVPRVDPPGNTMRALDYPVDAVVSVFLSGESPGYSVKKVGVDSLTGGSFGDLLNTQACRSGKLGQPVTLMPEARAILSVRGGVRGDKQFNPGSVCIQQIISEGQGIGVINLTPPELCDLFKGKSSQDSLVQRDPGYSATSVSGISQSECPGIFDRFSTAEGLRQRGCPNGTQDACCLRPQCPRSGSEALTMNDFSSLQDYQDTAMSFEPVSPVSASRGDADMCNMVLHHKNVSAGLICQPTNLLSAFFGC